MSVWGCDGESLNAWQLLLLPGTLPSLLPPSTRIRPTRIRRVELGRVPLHLWPLVCSPAPWAGWVGRTWPPPSGWRPLREFSPPPCWDPWSPCRHWGLRSSVGCTWHAGRERPRRAPRRYWCVRRLGASALGWRDGHWWSGRFSARWMSFCRCWLWFQWLQCITMKSESDAVGNTSTLDYKFSHATCGCDARHNDARHPTSPHHWQILAKWSENERPICSALLPPYRRFLYTHMYVCMYIETHLFFLLRCPQLFNFAVNCNYAFCGCRTFVVVFAIVHFSVFVLGVRTVGSKSAFGHWPLTTVQTIKSFGDIKCQ